MQRRVVRGLGRAARAYVALGTRHTRADTGLARRLATGDERSFLPGPGWCHVTIVAGAELHWIALHNHARPRRHTHTHAPQSGTRFGLVSRDGAANTSDKDALQSRQADLDLCVLLLNLFVSILPSQRPPDRRRAPSSSITSSLGVPHPIITSRPIGPRPKLRPSPPAHPRPSLTRAAGRLPPALRHLSVGAQRISIAILLASLPSSSIVALPHHFPLSSPPSSTRSLVPPPSTPTPIARLVSVAHIVHGLTISITSPQAASSPPARRHIRSRRSRRSGPLALRIHLFARRTFFL